MDYSTFSLMLADPLEGTGLEEWIAMNYLMLSLVVVILLLLGSWYMHLNNLNRVHKRIEALKGGETVPKEDFYREMTVPQGSNFNALAMAAWLMLFVAIAYLYLLIPNALPYSYMRQMPDWASMPYGFLAFGLGVAGLAAVFIFLVLDRLRENHRNLKLTELYSFYSLSLGMKKYIGLTIPMLAVSVIFSAWVGTIYPQHSSWLETLSFIFLIVSTGILVWPIWEGRK